MPPLETLQNAGYVLPAEREKNRQLRKMLNLVEAAEVETCLYWGYHPSIPLENTPIGMIIDQRGFPLRSIAFAYNTDYGLIAIYPCNVATQLTIVNGQTVDTIATAYKQKFPSFNGGYYRDGVLSVKRTTSDLIKVDRGDTYIRHLANEQVFVDGGDCAKTHYLELLYDEFNPLFKAVLMELSDSATYKFEGL